jgi:hypothetical protein
MAFVSRRSLLMGAAALGVAPRAFAQSRPEPAPIAGKGYALAFEDDFDTLDVGETGHRWTPHLWYERPASSDHYSAAQSVLTLRCLKRGGAWEGINLATEWADTRGGTFFRGGYFEARMKVPRAWPAFWLFSANHSRGVAKNAADPRTLCAEIDIYEGDSAHPTYFCGALHRNTSGQGGVRDEYNHNNCQNPGIDLTQDWHLFSVLWTRREVVWYLDRVETHRAPAFDSTWQDAFLILGIEPGGVLRGPLPPPDQNAVDLLVDWVRVWRGGEDVAG